MLHQASFWFVNTEQIQHLEYASNQQTFADNLRSFRLHDQMMLNPSSNPAATSRGSDPRKLEFITHFSPTDWSAPPVNPASLAPTKTNTIQSQKAQVKVKAKNEFHSPEHLAFVLQTMESVSSTRRDQEAILFMSVPNPRACSVQSAANPRPTLQTPHRANTGVPYPSASRPELSRSRTEPELKHQKSSFNLFKSNSSPKKEDEVILLNTVCHFLAFGYLYLLAHLSETSRTDFLF